jgi:hypothetical protein
MSEKSFTPAEVAKILGRSQQWVREAIECGELKASNLSLGKKRPRWIIPGEEFQKFLKNRGLLH